MILNVGVTPVHQWTLLSQRQFVCASVRPAETNDAQRPPTITLSVPIVMNLIKREVYTNVYLYNW